MVRLLVYLAFVAMIGSLLSISLVSAQYVSPSITNTSIVSLRDVKVNLFPGNSTTVGYTVSIRTGNTRNTSFVINDIAALSHYGINVITSAPYGEPTFNGSIIIHTSTDTPNGYYSLMAYAIGGDPSVNNATLTINVSNVIKGPSIVGNGTSTPSVNSSHGVGIAGNIQNAAKNNTNKSLNSTIPTSLTSSIKTTVASTTVMSSTAASTAPYTNTSTSKTGSSSSGLLPIAAIVIIIIIVLLLAYWYSSTRAKPKTVAHNAQHHPESGGHEHHHTEHEAHHHDEHHHGDNNK